LDSRSVSELQLDNAYVQPLEQNSFQRTQDGRPWLVHEVRYAIFPEQSGTLTIPPQVFTGRESSGRRSVFDFGSGGRQLQRRTEPLT
ncbi:MAG TPA: protein BatD, partial [Halieaceae bacterium]|nr:protein BatD [Halieaceae bacterium]